MALQPYTRSSEVAPFGFQQPSWGMQPFESAGNWDMMAADPIAQSMYSDPLVQRTVNNARMITKPMAPILYADIYDLGDKFEVQAGLYVLRLYQLSVWNTICLL